MAAKKIAKKPKKNGKTPKNGKANRNGLTAIRLAPSLKNGSTRTLLRQLAQGWELVSDAVSVTNPENDHLWYVNAGWRKLYGYTHADALDQPVTLLNRDDFSPVQRRDIATKTKRGGWSGRVLNRDAAGNVFAVDLQTRPLQDADGELLGYLGVAAPVRQDNISDERIEQLVEQHQATLSSELRKLLETALINENADAQASAHVKSTKNSNGNGRRKAQVVPGLGRLSQRELEIFTLIGRGLSTREIGEKLSLSQYTIQTHRNHIKDKLALPDSAAITYWAFKWAHSKG